MSAKPGAAELTRGRRAVPIDTRWRRACSTIPGTMRVANLATHGSTLPGTVLALALGKPGVTACRPVAAWRRAPS